MEKLVLKWIRNAVFILVFSLLKTFSSFGCTTPVFRYALEMWPAFNYTVEVVHNGNLTDEQILTLKQLKNSSTGNAPTNLVVIETANYGKYNIPEDKLPQILLFHPIEHRNTNIIWQGALTKENVGKIIDSPARQEILRNIQKGDAITWVLIESKDKVKNTEAFNTLSKELEILSEELKLATDATDVDGKLLDIEIINRGVHFSMISVSRSDPDEEVFIKMLLSTEPDLPFIKAPLAFPVFGRGRVLYALVGRGIKQKLIEETCNSVIGWCSCTIKEDNPGSDLLFTADWETVVGDSSWIKEVELPEITGMSGFIQEPETQPDNDKNTTVQKSESIQETIESKQKEELVEAETQQKEPLKSPSEKVEIAKEEKSISTKVTETKNSRFSLLTRNIVIVVLLLLIIMPTISFYLRKKRSNN